MKGFIGDFLENFGFTIINQVGSSAEALANATLFFNTVLDKDLASEDFYRLKIGNTASSGSFQIGSRVELPSNAGTPLIVYDAPDGEPNGNVKGLQSPGAKGTVVEETTLDDGSKWWNVDFDEGVDGWVTGNVLKPIDGVTQPPVVTTKLNDTGITACSSDSANGLPCPVHGFPGQDGEHGRDALAAAGLLQKVGGGSAGFDFTKLDADGNPLPADASEWMCVKDNHTGLIWEEKTTSGLRSMHHTYSWYNPDSSANGGHPGVQNGGNCSGSSCDTHSYVQEVNAQGLCGANDWRMPTRDELQGIVDYNQINLAIDTDYFPHTNVSKVSLINPIESNGGYYWSASPYAGDVNSVWGVPFASYHSPSPAFIRKDSTNNTFTYPRDGVITTYPLYNLVRLVRSGQ